MARLSGIAENPDIRCTASASVLLRRECADVGCCIINTIMHLALWRYVICHIYETL